MPHPPWMVWLRRRPTWAGRLAGVSLGWLGAQCQQGEVTLSNTSGTPVWLAVPWEATACLHVPAKIWVLRLLTQVSIFPCALLCNGPPHWMLHTPQTPSPPKDALARGPAKGVVGRPHFPIATPLHLHTSASRGGTAHCLCHRARWGHAGGELSTAVCQPWGTQEKCL